MKQKRNRSKKRHLPVDAVVYPDGSWFCEFKCAEWFKLPVSGFVVKPGGFGELICTAE